MLSSHGLDTIKLLLISFHEPSTFTFASSDLVFAVVHSDRPVKCLQRHQAHATPRFLPEDCLIGLLYGSSSTLGDFHWIDLTVIVASQEASSCGSRLLR